MTKEQVMITDPSGKSSIVMKDGTICLVGNVVLGGITATGRIATAPGGIIVAPITGTCSAPPGATCACPSPFVAAPNVYVGTGSILDTM
jgi:hypothetical protein